MLRYERLAIRPERPLTPEEALTREISQIEKLNQAGPIAHADHYTLNNLTILDLHKRINEILGIRYRPTWQNYFMQVGGIIATRGTCDRKFVGAVIVNDENQVIATGYNGSIPGQPHCSEIGHDMDEGHCIRTIHAETNAILQGARHGISLKEATIYTTASPCWKCFQNIVRTGIKKIVFRELYRDPRIKENAEKNNIVLVDFRNLKFNELWQKD
jgi:dCMP deaminase